MRTNTAALAFMTLVACVDLDEPPDAPDPPAPDGEVTPLFGDDQPLSRGVFEVGNTWHKDRLTVCWLAEIFDSTASNVQQLRELGEVAVLREWGRVGRVRFNSPWPRCPAAATHDIRIGFETEPRSTGHSKIGTDALLIPYGQATMGLSFDGRVPGCGGGSTPTACDGRNPEGLTNTDITSFEHLILHEFGHALGLRHEHAHQDSTCVYDEPLDDFVFDGESIFTFDEQSVMNYCSTNSRLSNGDIKVLHALYPGVVGLYSDLDFRHGGGGMLLPLQLGPGFFTSAEVPALTSTESIVVPPGYSVRICTPTQCTPANTTRTLAAPFRNGITSIEITPRVVGAMAFGYQGFTAALVGIGPRNSPFGIVGDNQMKSLLPGPTRAARVCTEPNGGGDCAGPFVGGGPPDAFKLGAGIYTSVSYVDVAVRAITYAGLFTGASNALTIGVYKANTAAGAFLPTVTSLAIESLEVRACTLEGIATPVSPGGAGDCRTYTKSVDLTTQSPPHGPIRFLQIKLPAGAQ